MTWSTPSEASSRCDRSVSRRDLVAGRHGERVDAVLRDPDRVGVHRLVGALDALGATGARVAATVDARSAAVAAAPRGCRSPWEANPQTPSTSTRTASPTVSSRRRHDDRRRAARSSGCAMRSTRRSACWAPRSGPGRARRRRGPRAAGRGTPGRPGGRPRASRISPRAPNLPAAGDRPGGSTAADPPSGDRVDGRRGRGRALVPALARQPGRGGGGRRAVGEARA